MAQKGKTSRKPWQGQISERKKREFIPEHDEKKRKESGGGGCLWAKPQQPALLESLNHQPHGPKLNIW